MTHVVVTGKPILQAEKGQIRNRKLSTNLLNASRRSGPCALSVFCPLAAVPRSCTRRGAHLSVYRPWIWEEPEAGFLPLLSPSVAGRGRESPRCGSGTGEWLPLASDKAAAIGNCYPTWSSLLPCKVKTGSGGEIWSKATQLNSAGVALNLGIE